VVIRDVAALKDVSITRLRRNEYGAIKVADQNAQAAAMIAVFMGNQDSIERVGIFAEHGHAPDNLARSSPAFTSTRVPLATNNTALPVEPLPRTESFMN
jgi:hypothetical protein